MSKHLGKRRAPQQTVNCEARVFRCFGGDSNVIESGGTPVKLGNAHRTKRTKKQKKKDTHKPTTHHTKPKTSTEHPRLSEHTSKPLQTETCVHKGHILSENENLPEPEFLQVPKNYPNLDRKEAFKQLDLNIQAPRMTHDKAKGYSSGNRLPNETKNSQQKNIEQVRSKLDLNHDQLEISRI
jgi:hypothetical protein